LNLVVNARDAVSPGARIVVETSNEAVDAGIASHIGIREGDYVVVSVTDDGTGMAPDVIAQAFDPFFTTKEVGRGSGLGLSQVYGFVKSSSGHVRIESEVGKGTTVQLYLPKSSTAVAIAAPAPTEFPIRAAHGNEAILAVEDDDAVLGLAVAGLEELGYTVHTARNAADALIVLRSNAIVDVLFSDVIMPGGMNGAQLAVEARRIRPALKSSSNVGIYGARIDNSTRVASSRSVGKALSLRESCQQASVSHRERILIQKLSWNFDQAATRSQAFGTFRTMSASPSIARRSADLTDGPVRATTGSECSYARTSPVSRADKPRIVNAGLQRSAPAAPIICEPSKGKLSDEVSQVRFGPKQRCDRTSAK
jgi:CheY-like chemotaxis protein